LISKGAAKISRVFNPANFFEDFSSFPVFSSSALKELLVLFGSTKIGSFPLPARGLGRFFACYEKFLF
jgi:hypothetical protein